MERVKTTPESYARKMDFIEHALADGAHLHPPLKTSGRPMPEEVWDRLVDIGLLYHAGPETTGPSLAAMYSVTDEAIRQSRNRFLVGLYKNSSGETKKMFPLNSIALGKPVTLPQRERTAKVMGGLGLKVKSLMEEGINDSEVIISKLGTTRARLKATAGSGMFKAWGLNLEVKRLRRSFKEVGEKVEGMTNDGELQKYLDGFSAASLRGYIHRKNLHQTIFGNFGEAMKEAGIKGNRYTRPVALKLKALGLPLRLVPGCIQTVKGHQYQETYFIYFLKHKPRAIEMVNALGPLDQNPEILSLKKTSKV